MKSYDKIKEFVAERKGLTESEVAEMNPNSIIGLAIAVIVASAVLPSAISTIFNANTTGWSTGAVALWDALPIIVIAAIVVGFYAVKKGKQ